ncbi:MAG: hypothetical protein DME08_07315 [Candidatus Rokuibacteriota bacterium]|nr:MAG: hypothetical protein DME08_07315 [Candidatus Rokubacteria bacterium]
MRTRLALLLQALIIVLVLVAPAPPALAQDKPRHGGELVFVVPTEPPTLDGHREGTFGLLHPGAPHYNTLLRMDPTDVSGTRVIGDLAESWTITDGGRTYTLKLRRGVRFHDGSEMTSRDVKASYDRIVFPPAGVSSFRKGQYTDVEAVEAPDSSTVVFRLKWPSASFLTALASPFSWIYKADILARDQHWYEKNVMGTGPFVFVEYQRGSHWIAKKNPNYWDKGKPYLDGYRAIFIKDNTAQVAAIRSERAHIQFRGFTPTERDGIVAALGSRVTVQESPWDCGMWVAMNHEKKPWDDKRARRALTLALDRYQGSQALSRIAIVKFVNGVQVPGTPFATPPTELEKLAGYGRDIEKCSWISGGRSDSTPGTSSSRRPSGRPICDPGTSRSRPTLSAATPSSPIWTSPSSSRGTSAATIGAATRTACSTTCTRSRAARSIPTSAAGTCGSSSGGSWTTRRTTFRRSSGTGSSPTARSCAAGRSRRATI